MQFPGPLFDETTALLGGDMDRWAFLGIALVVLALGYVARPHGRSRGKRWRPRRKHSALPGRAESPGPDSARRAERPFDSTAQMRAIAPFEFETQPLLNQGEARLLYLLERVAAEVGGGFRVMAQTSLGEILRPRPMRGPSGDVAQAYRAINSKRLDLAIFNRFGKLIVGVEYQGHGHYRETAFMRDAIKREVLRRAGVPMLEVPAEFQEATVAAEVNNLLSAHLALLRTAKGTERQRSAAEKRSAA